MHIQQVSSRTGVSARLLRYYESMHLLKPRRLENGYRVYTLADIEKINSIKYYLELGVKIKEIANIIKCYDEDYSDPDCRGTAMAFYSVKLDNIRREIGILKSKEESLSLMINKLKLSNK